MPAKFISVGKRFDEPVKVGDLENILLDKIAMLDGLMSLKGVDKSHHCHGYEISFQLTPDDTETQPKQESLSKLGSYVLKFGAHAGPLSDAPLDYLSLILRLQEESVKAISAYLNHPDMRKELEFED